jgi:protein involved in polysaccharide export with SLBB domain
MIGRIELASLRVCVLAALVLLPLSSARAEYVPRRGDVLDGAVPSAPVLDRRLIVDSDGNVTLPFLGQVKAGHAALRTGAGACRQCSWPGKWSGRPT